MGLGGLLANAIGGGVVGAAEGSQERHKENLKREETDIQSQRQVSLEALRAKNNRSTAEFTAAKQAEQSGLDRQSRERIAKLSSSRTSKPSINPYIAKAVEGVDNKLKPLYKAKAEGGVVDPAYISALEQQRTFLLGGGFAPPQAQESQVSNSASQQPQTQPVTQGQQSQQPQTQPANSVQQSAAVGNSAVEQDEIDRQERNNGKMSKQIGGLLQSVGDFFEKDRGDAAAQAFRKFGEREPNDNPQYVSWLKEAFPSLYQDKVKQGEIKP